MKTNQGFDHNSCFSVMSMVLSFRKRRNNFSSLQDSVTLKWGKIKNTEQTD